MALKYWDGLKSFIGDSLGAIVSVPSMAGKNLTNAAIQVGFQKTNPQVNTEALTSNMNEATAAKSAATLKKSQELARQSVDSFLKPTEEIGAAQAADSLFGLVDQVYTTLRPVVTEPLSAYYLTAADFYSNQGLNLLKNWNLAKEVSPGQAMSNYYSEGLDQFGITDYAKKEGLKLPTFLDPNFNIADPIARKKAFQDEIFGKITSGFLDGTVAWYTDPLVIGGKAIAAGRRMTITRPINSYDDVITMRADLDTHGIYVKTEGAMGRKTPIGMAAERLVGKNTVEALTDPLVKNSTNPRLLARLTGNANTYDDVADIIAASAGDATSMNKLRVNQAATAEEITRQQNILTDMQKDLATVDWGAGSVPEKILAKEAEKVKMQSVLDDLMKRDENLRVALTERVGDYRLIQNLTAGINREILGTNIGVQIERLRGLGAAAEHNVTFFPKSFQDNWLGQKVSSITMAWNKLPSGIVRVDGGGLADSGTELKAIINSIPDFKLASSADEAAINLETKTKMIDDYISATSAKERRNALKAIEEQAVDVIAARHGYDAAEAKEMYKAWDQMKARILDDFESRGSFIDDNGDIVVSAFWKSEMPNIVPMLDFKDFDNFLGSNKTIISLKTGAEESFDMLNSFFKVSVLTRLGYPIRNTIEGQTRIMTILNSMVKADDVISNFAKNTATRAKRASLYATRTISITNPRQINSGLNKLIYQRNSMVDARASMLDQILEKQYYAGATGVFGRKLEKETVESAILSETLLKEKDTMRFLELQYKMKEQEGLLFGKDHKEYLDILNKAYKAYVKKEVLPTLPKDVTLVYADAFGGGVYYKLEGSVLPRKAVGDFETRKGFPAQMLGDIKGPVKEINIRGKEPSPDVRIFTTYEKSRDVNYENIAELLGEEYMTGLRTFTQNINMIDEEVMSLIEKSMKLNAARAELKIVRSGEKPFIVITPSGKRIEFSGAYQGPNADLIRSEASGAKTLNWMSEQDGYVTFNALKGSKMPGGGRRGQFTGEPVKVAPTDPQYWQEMSRIVNQIYRNDQLAMRLLLNQSDEEIAGWLLSKKGQFYLREIDADVSRKEVLLHIQEARSRIQKTIPDPLVRQLVAKEELTPQQFEILLRDQPNLDLLAGQEFVENGLRVGRGSVRRKLQKMASNVINTIGTMPEDRLVSWPFYQRLYENALRQEVRLAERAGKDIASEDWILQAQRTAHDTARTTLNKTLYRVFNNTGASSFMRFVVPFFNAQYNAVWFYGKTFVKDPSKLARASMIWNSPNRVATVVDEEGNKVPTGVGPSTPAYLLFTLSPEQRKTFGIPGGYNVYIPKNSLNIFLQGENPLAPAFGLPVMIPTTVIANSKPEWIDNIDKFVKEIAGEKAADMTLRSILPFGRSVKEPVSQAFPAWLQKSIQRVEGDDNKVYASIVGTAMKVNEIEWRKNGQVGPRPTYDDAIKTANQLYKIRIAANLTLPVAITLKPEWQFIVNEYVRALKDPNVGPEKVFDFLYDKWGIEGLIATAPSTRTETGVVKTIGAVKNAKKYKNLISQFDKSYQRLPLLAGFIANYGTVDSGGEEYSANYFSDRKLRAGGKTVWSESRAADDVVEDREIQIGWAYYQKFKEALNIELVEQKISGLGTAASRDAGLDDEWEDSISQLKEYLPVWAKAFDNPQKVIGTAESYVKGLETIVQDKKWMADNGKTPGAQAIVGFLETRKVLVEDLQQRKRDGGSANIENPDNVDLLEDWKGYIRDLSIYSTEFANLYSRVLENDKLGVIK
jgi:hypothetical protein